MKTIISIVLINLWMVSVSASVIKHRHTHHADDVASADTKEDPNAIGQPVKSKKFSRTIEITMNDQMKFDPSNISIKKGETVKFIVKNIGSVVHEIVMGSPEEIKEHAEMMKKMPGMKHKDANQLTLDPKKSGSMVWKFSKSGVIEYACLQPGHNEAGMNGKITIE